MDQGQPRGDRHEAGRELGHGVPGRDVLGEQIAYPFTPICRQSAAGVRHAQELTQNKVGNGSRQLRLDEQVATRQPCGDPQQAQAAAQPCQDTDGQRGSDQKHVQGCPQQIETQGAPVQPKRTAAAEMSCRKVWDPGPAGIRVRGHLGLGGRG